MPRHALLDRDAFAIQCGFGRFRNLDLQHSVVQRGLDVVWFDIEWQWDTPVGPGHWDPERSAPQSSQLLLELIKQGERIPARELRSLTLLNFATTIVCRSHFSARAILGAL